MEFTNFQSKYSFSLKEEKLTNSHISDVDIIRLEKSTLRTFDENKISEKLKYSKTNSYTIEDKFQLAKLYEASIQLNTDDIGLFDDKIKIILTTDITDFIDNFKNIESYDELDFNREILSKLCK